MLMLALTFMLLLFAATADDDDHDDNDNDDVVEKKKDVDDDDDEITIFFIISYGDSESALRSAAEPFCREFEPRYRRPAEQTALLWTGYTQKPNRLPAMSVIYF
ncbi:hypothetical protein PoB_007039500 [Plakobranchus ocellatus]|uniref:Secreted protein n=1 Tax=Plakobranchus ocellatus TaxID=259542 RepID=A0AAV4DIQ6_9GAST|nr:hypothetical protein PoB_007039500 [Plakobranchus ocellatus]